VVPELVQTEATPDNLRRELDKVLNDGAARQAQLVAFDDLESLLGPDDAITQSAQLALDIGIAAFGITAG
jgi:lipid A disaccharide synthetase